MIAAAKAKPVTVLLNIVLTTLVICLSIIVISNNLYTKAVGKAMQRVIDLGRRIHPNKD